MMVGAPDAVEDAVWESQHQPSSNPGSDRVSRIGMDEDPKDGLADFGGEGVAESCGLLVVEGHRIRELGTSRRIERDLQPLPERLEPELFEDLIGGDLRQASRLDGLQSALGLVVPRRFQRSVVIEARNQALREPRSFRRCKAQGLRLELFDGHGRSPP